MITWNNLDTLASYKKLFEVEKVNLAEAMSGENGAERVRKYSVPMAEGLAYNFAAKQVDDKVLDGLKKRSLRRNSRLSIMERLSIREKNVWFFII